MQPCAFSCIAVFNLKRSLRISVTIRDIAKIAGVSHSTVSRSLNDSPLISEETKERIKKIAADCNFEFNSSARSLSTQKTGTIGIILPDFYAKFGSTSYLGLLMRGMRSALEEGGFDSIHIYSENQFTKESNIKRIINQGKVDGIMIMSPDISRDDIQFIQKSGMPFIFVHFIPKEKERFNFVYTDHVCGGYQATEQLIKMERKKILCLSEPQHQFEERTEGYKQCLADYDIEFDPNLIFRKNCSFEFGYEVVKENPDIIKNIDSIFAEADLMALGAIQALKEENIRIPEDIAVVGYDDIELGHYFSPKLTTVHQPREEHARLACSRLIEMINGGGGISILQTITIPKLIVRESCGAVQAGSARRR